MAKRHINHAFISTHTLTWSVTFLVRSIALHLTISTHTLTWSVTQVGTLDCMHDQNFNSHAHVERDGNDAATVAPTIHFNSHAHVERDVVPVTSTPLILIFQLTRSRGA